MNYYEQDIANSVTSLSSSTGVLADTYAYDSFGNVKNSTGTVENPFQYAGRELDSETGLNYTVPDSTTRPREGSSARIR